MNRKTEPMIQTDDRPGAPNPVRTPVFHMNFATWHAHLAGSTRLVSPFGSERSPQRDLDPLSSSARSANVDNDGT